jgi:hypothetical protein
MGKRRECAISGNHAFEDDAGKISGNVFVKLFMKFKFGMVLLF